VSQIPPLGTPSPAVPTPAALTTSCHVGYIVSGAGFYPNTRAGLHAAVAAQNRTGSSVAMGGVVTLTNTGGTGVTVSGFTVGTFDAQGTPVSVHPVSGGYDLPRFLGPGESDSFTLNWADLPGGVYVSTREYLGASCKVTGWQ
jgi:hypothetical protein